MSDEKLSYKEYRDLTIEAGLGLVPYVGGSLQTLYFGAQNEKRFKRIESFYQQLSLKVSELDSFELNYSDGDGLIGIIDRIHEEIEKARSHDKIIYFVNAYKNLLLYSKGKDSFDTEEYFIEILSEITNIDLKILSVLFRWRNGKGKIPTGYTAEITIGAVERLSNFGLVDIYLNRLVSGEPINRNSSFSITDLGITFCEYILH